MTDVVTLGLAGTARRAQAPPSPSTGTTIVFLIFLVLAQRGGGYMAQVSWLYRDTRNSIRKLYNPQVFEYVDYGDTV